MTTGDTDLWVYTTGDLDTVGKLTDSGGDVVASSGDARLPPRPHNFSLRAEVEAGTYTCRSAATTEHTPATTGSTPSTRSP